MASVSSRSRSAEGFQMTSFGSTGRMALADGLLIDSSGVDFESQLKIDDSLQKKCWQTRASGQNQVLAKNVVGQDNETGEGINRQAVAAMHYVKLLIRAVCRLRVDLNRAGIQINQPDQRDQGAGVERHLDVAIKLDGRVRDFDDQQNIR